MNERKYLITFGLGFVIFGGSITIYNIFTTLVITAPIIIFQVSALITLFCGIWLLLEYRKKNKSLEKKN